MNKRVMRAAVAAVAMGGFLLGTAGTASAAYDKDGKLESGEFGLYYNSGLVGCVFDVAADNDFSNDYFKAPSGSCNGKGQTTNDNTASYWNRSVFTQYVFTDWYKEGIQGSLPSGYSGDASSNFKNEISSTSITGR
ncbi:MULTISPECIES: hypothetical protein [unclassified Streptomyces]|uniref:hypothetical protein n=1 Tax=Streptomyces sp. NPDC127129 TaxID=3345373 RepID=UPI00362D9F6A